jgi:hypothetical protein
MPDQPIILTDPASVSAQVWREREARATLEFLGQVQPSNAAPYTHEDMAIFVRQLQRNGVPFREYMNAAYQDYKTFFLAALTAARSKVWMKLT